MAELTNTDMIQETLSWIQSFIIKYNICPFAKHVISQDRVKLEIVYSKNTQQALEVMMSFVSKMDNHSDIETAFLIFPSFLSSFDDYLDFASLAEKLLNMSGYEGTYQLATFHPDYCFAGTKPSDVSNYTNRSPYPMLHILRESSIDKAIEFYGDTSQIPENNIALMQKLGQEKISLLLKKSNNRPKAF